jgi:hypothetical protein
MPTVSRVNYADRKDEACQATGSKETVRSQSIPALPACRFQLSVELACLWVWRTVKQGYRELDSELDV